MLRARFLGASDRARRTVGLSPLDLACVVVRLASVHGSYGLLDREVGSSCVSLLDFGSAVGAESLVRVGDAVAVSIGDDCSEVTAPCSRVAGALWSSDVLQPRLRVSDRGVKERVGALFDEGSSLVQGLAHFGLHEAGGLSDESDDQSWGRSWTAVSVPMPCDADKPVMEDCCGVVGLMQWSGGDQSR